MPYRCRNSEFSHDYDYMAEENKLFHPMVTKCQSGCKQWTVNSFKVKIVKKLDFLIQRVVILPQKWLYNKTHKSWNWNSPVILMLDT